MKRWMQKLISVLMSLALVLSLGVTAFAGDEGTADSGPTQEELAEQERIKEEEERKRREAEEAAAKAAAEQEAAAKAAAQNNDAQNNAEVKSVQKQDVEQKDVEQKDVEQKDVEQKDVEQKDVELKDELKKEDIKDELQKEDVKDELQKEDVKDELKKDDVKDELQKEDVKDGLKKDDVKDELQKEDVKDELKKDDLKDELQKGDVKDELIITEPKQEEGSSEDEKEGENQNDPQPVLPLSSMFKSDVTNYRSRKAALMNSVADGVKSGASGASKENSKEDITQANGSDPVNADGVRNADQGTESENVILRGNGGSKENVLGDSLIAGDNTEIKVGNTVITVNGKEFNNSTNAPVEGINGNVQWTKDGTLSVVSNPPNPDGDVSGTASITTIEELVVKEGDLTIQAAGLNRINKLVTNNVVNIIGTGILLLDDYDLKDSGEVKLTENLMYAEDTGVTGSVAVFLKDKDASTSANSTYKLINNGVPGILDESYLIPSGVNLVLPSGESLIMNSTVAVKNSDPKKPYTYYSGSDVPKAEDLDNPIENSALLKVSSGASLTVEKGAEIKMISTKSVESTTESGVNILTPIIELESGAKLVQNGKLTGTGGFVVSKKDGDYKTEETVDIEAIVMPIIVKNPDPIYQELLEKGHNPNNQDDYVTYEELKDAWNSVNKDHPIPAEENPVFIIKIDGHTVYVKEGGSFTFPVKDKWTAASMGNPYTGVGIQSHELGATGSGLLVDPSFKFPGGSSKVILAATKEKENLWRVIVTENPKRGTWTLSVWYGDTQIFDLGITTVRARFKFDKPNDWDTKNIYVVFIDKDGKSLKAFPAKYDAITEELVFDSSLVGEFVVVQFDYQGELYSKGFYDELAKLDAVRHLVDLHNGKVK